MGETGHDKNYWRIRTIPRSTDNVHLQNLAVHFLCYLFLDNSQFVSYYLWFRNYFYPKVLSRLFMKSILCMFYSVICVHQSVAFTYKWQVIWRILCHIFFLHYHVLFHYAIPFTIACKKSEVIPILLYLNITSEVLDYCGIFFLTCRVGKPTKIFVRFYVFSTYFSSTMDSWNLTQVLYFLLQSFLKKINGAFFCDFLSIISSLFFLICSPGYLSFLSFWTLLYPFHLCS